MNTSNATQNRFWDVVLLAFAVLILLLFGLRTISGSDLWMHLAAGRHVLEHGPARFDPFSFGLPTGTPWLQATWLYDVMVFALWPLGGAPMLILLHTAAVVGAFLLLIFSARAYSNARHQAVALLLCAWILAPLFTLRPLLFCLLFMAIFIHVLSRPRLGWGSVIILGLTQLLWVNMHPSFLLGIALALAKGVETMRTRPGPTEESPPAPSRRPLVALVVALPLLSLINPFGWQLWPTSIGLIFRPESGVMLEWISPFFPDFLPLRLTYFTTAALALIASVFIFRRERLPLLLTVCAAISAYFMVQSNHLLEVCALLAFPFIGMSVATLSTLIAGRLPEVIRSKVTTAAGALIGLVIAVSAFWIVTNRYYIHSGSASEFGLRVNTDLVPVAVIDTLIRHQALPERMLNVAQDGGYLLWQLPGRKVYTDPRGGLYGGLFFNRMAKALTGQKDGLTEESFLPETDAILLNATWSGARTATLYFLQTDQWAIGYFDGTSLLLLRKTSANRARLENAALSQRGLELIRSDFEHYRMELSNRLFRPANPARLIGASSVYHALGRFQESLALLELITEGTPRMASAWVNRGIAEVALNKTEAAIKTLTHAVTILPSHPLPWLWLGRAYQLQGREAEATAARKQASAINQAFVDRFDSDQTLMSSSPGFTTPTYYDKP